MSLSVACGGGNNTTDGGTTPMEDSPAATPDAGPMFLAAGETTQTLDLGCRGTATRPAAGAATMGTLNVTEFLSQSMGTPQPISSTMIDIFTDNVITDTCAAPGCITVTTDAMGHATAMAPAGAWMAFHIHTSSATAETLAYSFPWTATAGGNVNTAGFASGTITLVSSLLGRTFQTATAGAISGQVNDCMDQHVLNAEARVFMGTTQIVTGMGNTSARITGLSSSNAPTRAGLTGTGGIFVGANVPPGNDYHVEIWGTPPGGAAAELIGCEEGRVVTGGITVLTIGPLRGDYVAGSACATAAAAAH